MGREDRPVNLSDVMLRRAWQRHERRRWNELCSACATVVHRVAQCEYLVLSRVNQRVGLIQLKFEVRAQRFGLASESGPSVC